MPNVRVEGCSIQIYTKALGRLASNIDSKTLSKLRGIYDVGLWASCVVGTPLAFAILLVSLYRYLSWLFLPDIPAPTPIFTPILPGANIPLSSIGYLLFALLVSAIVHEGGHALAASGERVPVLSAGFIFFFIFPGAFVELGDYQNLHPRKKLRILSAGAWNNALLAFFAYLFIFSIGRPTKDGPVISKIHHASPLHGILRPGDVLSAVDDCSLHTATDFTACLRSLAAQAFHDQPKSGYCLPVKEGSDDCCKEGYSGSSSLMCFETTAQEGGGLTMLQTCMHPREASKFPKCGGGGNAQLGSFCKIGLECFRPIESFILLKVSDGRQITFVGSPSELFREVTLIDIPPIFRFMGPTIFSMLQKAIRFTFTLSSALALLNVAPVKFLDGEKMVQSVIEWLFCYTNRATNQQDFAFWKRMSERFVNFCTWILVANIVLSVFKVFV